ncbi:putative metallo-beta-lactamase superfamily protein [Magnetofaba australis IT-1]|uniref:Putative metallo-beta-lactamase superfamily protein n=1 Tax=Magnetofaba australis IT-1 TaxID=1434232 RepID=A0A1Y2JZ34_9PROT|nr:putative metallo-beta-lactamase superfamily protein [Magnetofaba australis IT-1]
MKVAIGARVMEVRALFADLFNDMTLVTEAPPFDLLLEDEQEFSAGTLHFKTLFTPGHTPACVSYWIGDAAFVGDLVMMPDLGSGRCDFPGADPEAMYESIGVCLFALPDTTRLFVGHDYPPETRDMDCETSVLEIKRKNRMINADTEYETFLARRRERDRELAFPELMWASVQVNLNAGQLPKPEANGISYLRIPISKA